MRAQAERIAQRIVDEIGHPVTDEPALGPEYREQIATLTAELAEARVKAEQATLLAVHHADELAAATAAHEATAERLRHLQECERTRSRSLINVAAENARLRVRLATWASDQYATGPSPDPDIPELVKTFTNRRERRE